MLVSAGTVFNAIKKARTWKADWSMEAVDPKSQILNRRKQGSKNMEPLRSSITEPERLRFNERKGKDKQNPYKTGAEAT